MRIIKVIPAKHWINHVTGAKASIYGSRPFFSDSEGINWSIEENSYTWQVEDSRGNITIGIGRVPVKTLQEANEVMEKFNNR